MGLENSFEKKMLHIICELCFTTSGSDERKLAKTESNPEFPPNTNNKHAKLVSLPILVGKSSANGFKVPECFLHGSDTEAVML